MSTDYSKNKFYRENKWQVRVIRRGQDNDSAEIVKCCGFPDEQVLARAVWPDHAKRVCDEHNDALAKLLFPQDFEAAGLTEAQDTQK